jgi:hypothetical protein
MLVYQRVWDMVAHPIIRDLQYFDPESDPIISHIPKSRGSEPFQAGKGCGMFVRQKDVLAIVLGVHLLRSTRFRRWKQN